MKSDNWVERFVAARLAEHDEHVRLRRAKRDAVKLATGTGYRAGNLLSPQAWWRDTMSFESCTCGRGRARHRVLE
jgi:hypothetical protein